MQGVPFELSELEVKELAYQFPDRLAAEKLGIATSTFFLLRKKYNIPSFTQLTGNRISQKDGTLLPPGVGVYHPQYSSLVTDFFECIDSPDKAYFLGLIAADGHLTTNPKTGCYLSVELQQPDSDVLLHLRSLLNCHCPLMLSKRQHKKPSGRLVIYSRKLVESLIRKGITLDTESHSVPYDIPSNLRSHCVRGLMDGDGHIKASSKYMYFGSCSEVLINIVSLWVKEELNITTSYNGCLLPSGKLFHKISFGGKPKEFLSWAYNDSTTVIARKKAEADMWLSRF